MSWQERERRARRRERMTVSVLSLLILFSLLGGYFYLRVTQERVGKLSTISTSEVTISINEAPPPAAEGAAGPTATPPAARASDGGRGTGVRAEVVGGGEASASAGGRPDIATSGGQQVPGSTVSPTSTGGSRTGIVAGATSVSGPSIGLGDAGSGSSPSGGSQGSNPTRTPRPAATTAPPDPTTESQPTSVPNTPPPTATPQPTTPPQPTSLPDNITPLGHNSHVSMPGFSGPGAYTTGGILVSNVGPVAFNYSLSMTVTGSAEFGAVLRFRIYLRVGTSCNYPGQPPAPNADLLPLTGDQVGSVIYDGTFTTGNKFGDPTVELATGDRPLGIGASEVLCMEVFFPWTAGNEYQGLAVNGTMVFTAKSPE